MPTKLGPMKSDEVPPALAKRLKKLEEEVAELRAETGVEAFELRARVRALESRLEELAQPAGASAAAPAARPQRPARARTAAPRARKRRSGSS